MIDDTFDFGESNEDGDPEDVFCNSNIFAYPNSLDSASRGNKLVSVRKKKSSKLFWRR
jgi:hypothetical protein